MLRPLNAALGFLFATSALPAAAQTGNDEQASRLVRQMAEELQKMAPLPGLSVAISRDGHVVFAEGFGYADIENRKPVTPASRFRTASVGKVISATVLGRLMQEGRIQLDVPIQAYVPTFPVKAWPVTARQLAGHLSGMPHYSDADSLEQRFYPTALDALTVFEHEPLLAELNTRYSYSIHGFTLLSAVMEAAAGAPFLDFLQREILEPLGMTSTGPDLRARPSPELATFYSWNSGSMVRIDEPEDPSYKWAGGGMVSSPTDLLRLATGYSNGFLDAATVNMLWSTQRLPSGTATGVGLAWRNGMDVDGRRVIEHAGSMEGARAVLAIFPEERVSIALMTNREWSSTIEETAHLLAYPFLTVPSPRKQPLGTFDVTVKTVSVSGEVQTQPGTLTLAPDRGHLGVQMASGAEQQFELFYLQHDDVYAFVRVDGIYRTNITIADGVLSGEVIGYGSPQLTSPSANEPFMSFVGEIRTL